MKSILLFLLITFSSLSFSQPAAIGYVVYELGTEPRIQTIEFWFGENEYNYRFQKEVPDFGSFVLKSATSNPLEDSLKKQKLLKMLEERIKKEPVQQWYGRLGTNEINYSTFDNTFKCYCISDSIAPIAWTLQSDTTTINGIKCQRALGKRGAISYRAWFAPGIPTSAAPMDYRGLPGLIISVSSETTGFQMNLKELEFPLSSRKLELKSCDQGVYISKQEFSKLQAEQNKRVQQRIETINGQ